VLGVHEVHEENYSVLDAIAEQAANKRKIKGKVNREKETRKDIM